MKNDEGDVFARAMAAMAKVKRIVPDPRGRVHAVPPATRAAAPVRPAPPSARSAAPASDPDDDTDASFAASGVDRRELRKLRRGDYAPVRRLDLHGLTGAEAVAKVKRFIEASRVTCRSVAIVHGRGLHSKDNVAVLKTRVRACLRQHPGVLAFTDAPNTDGGAGAVYVLLKKN